jgi:hypothetical protein
MKRSIVASVLGCIICLLISTLAGAQAPTKSKEQKAVPKQTQQKTAPGQNKWKSLTYKGKTVFVMPGFEKKSDCPKLEDRTPEMALLKLEADQYEDFKHDPAAFVNNLDFFTCKIDMTKGLRHLTGTAKAKAATPGGDPVVAVIHEPDCGGRWYDVP